MDTANQLQPATAHQSGQADLAIVAARRTLEAGAVLVYLPADRAASEAVRLLGTKIAVTIAGPLCLARKLEA